MAGRWPSPMGPTRSPRRSSAASGSSRPGATTRCSSSSRAIRISMAPAPSRCARSRTRVGEAESRVPPPEVSALVEHLFRHSAGQMVSRLARWLGAARLDLAEEAVQDALVRALQTWPFGGVPAEPRAWLFQVARHRALDLIRRDAALRGKLDALDRADHFPEADVRDTA